MGIAIKIIARLNGSKTYIAAAGLAGLAIYQLSQGQLTEGARTIGQALAAAGIRHAITKGTGQ